MSLIETFTILFKIDAEQAIDDLNIVKNKIQEVSSSLSSGISIKQTELSQTKITLEKTKQQTSQIAQNVRVVNTEFKSTAAVITKVSDSTENTAKSVSKFTKLSELANDSAKKLGQSFLNSAKQIDSSLLKPINVLFSFSGAFDSAMKQADKLDNLGKIASQSRIGVKNLDLLSRAARSLGGDVDAAQRDIKNFSNSVSTALADKGSNVASTFDKLGVSLTNQNGKIKNTGKLIGELSQKMRNIDQPQKMQMLNGLGIQDPGMRKYIMSTGKTQKRVMSEQKDNGAVTQKQVDNAREFKQAQAELKIAIDGVSTELFATLGPALTETLKRLKDFVLFAKENKIIMVAFFGAIAIAAGSYAVSMGAAVAATVAATWPILAIVAAVGLLGYGIYKLIPFLKNLPQLFSNFVESSPKVKEALNMLGEAWEGLKARAEPIINFFKAVWGMITSAWSGDMEGMKKYALDALNAVKQFFENTWNDISAIVGKIVTWIKDQLWDMLPGWAKRWLGGDGAAKREEVEAQERSKASIIDAQRQIQLVIANTVPANAAEAVRTENVENNSQTNVNVASPTFNIQTTETTKVIQYAAQKTAEIAFSKSLNSASNYQDDGVER